VSGKAGPPKNRHCAARLDRPSGRYTHDFIVASIYNEHATIEGAAAALARRLPTVDYQIIIMDDAWSGCSWQLLSSASARQS
jgi:hypothetical protein